MDGDIQGLWLEATSHPKPLIPTLCPQSINDKLARDGRYGKAVQALDSLGIAPPDDLDALRELIARHPISDHPTSDPELPLPSQ